MHNSQDIVNQCFEKLGHEEAVEQVANIPSVLKSYMSCWKVMTEIQTNSGIDDIELYVGIRTNFPYTLPDVYFLNEKYDYFPHIGYDDRKLCLWEDGVTYDTKDSMLLIRESIKRAKRLIETSAKKENIQDFKNEIWSHWISKFSNEKVPYTTWLFYGSIPKESSILRVWSYQETVLNETTQRNIVVIKDCVDSQFETYISSKPKFNEVKAIFLKSVLIPEIPPYDITPRKVTSWIKDCEDFRMLKDALNKESSAIILFQLYDTPFFGGFIIPVQPHKRKGHRKVIAFDELFKFEKQVRNLHRIAGKCISRERMIERTSNQYIEEKTFAIAGVGSIGSNLCYFLDSLMPSKYILVDNDILQPENLGRHMLGYNYLQYSKVTAMEDYLRNKHHDIRIDSYVDSLLNISPSELNMSDALFLCTGDVIVEQYILSLLESGELGVPTFIIWLEPFCIAGHMVYINPKSKLSGIQLYHNNSVLYIHNLIDSAEYQNRSDIFTKRDAGCNGSYALYSNNDVTLFLAAIYPCLSNLLSNEDNSKCIRWVGNINIAKEKGIKLSTSSVISGLIEEFPL